MDNLYEYVITRWNNKLWISSYPGDEEVIIYRKKASFMKVLDIYNKLVMNEGKSHMHWSEDKLVRQLHKLNCDN